MSRELYVALIRDLLGDDPHKIRNANNTLYREAVGDGGLPDLVLAEAAA